METSRESLWRSVFKKWVPGLGMFGAGIAAIGAYHRASGITLVGALISVLATMISAVRQAEFRDRLLEANERLREADEKLLTWSGHAIATMTGGDSYAYLKPGLFDEFWHVMLSGDYSIYDLTVRVVDMRKGKYLIPPPRSTYPWETHIIGNVSHNLLPSTIKLSIDWDSERELHVTFEARNGTWQRHIKGVTIDDLKKGLCLAYKMVFRPKGR